MTESTHDLIAAKAARLRELMQLNDGDTANDVHDPAGPDAGGERTDRPSWSGGSWNN